MRKTLERRLLMWKCGDVYNLLCEARFAQRLKMEGVKSCKTNDNAQVTKRAINLIKNEFVENKCCECANVWVEEMNKLNKVIDYEAFAGYILLTRALQHRQIHLLRTCKTESSCNGRSLWRGVAIFAKGRNCVNQKRERISGNECKKEVIASSRMDLETVMRHASVIGASSWLSSHHDMRELFLNSTEFHDVLAARYNWNHAVIGKDCQCGAPFTVSHALSSKSMGPLLSDTMPW
ncbi:hypothetical protein GJ496_003576 [Pomphorhynchus laevis]|nr:hypothetical protein GJ496_003576 [Pomphorhynchus laevis]